MVQAGQFAERPTLVPSGGQVLEALWHRGDRAPGCLILPPPPELGGGMDHVVASELVWALSRAGHPTLRFNFRGVGASPGTRGDASAQREDAQAALALLRDNIGSDPALVIALSGSETCALHLAQVSPPPLGIGFINPLGLPKKLPRKVDLWALVCARSHPPRAEPSACPGLGGSEQGSSVVSRGEITVVTVPAADATFRKNLPEVGRLAAQWAQRHCARSDPPKAEPSASPVPPQVSIEGGPGLGGTHREA